LGVARLPDGSEEALIDYRDASPQVRAVYDDIKRTRQVDDVNNFWKYLANDPPTLLRTWQSIKEIMAPGALDPLTKEMVYLAVSVTNGCAYCIASHGAAARKAGMSEAMFGELMAVVAWRTKPTGRPTAIACRSIPPSNKSIFGGRPHSNANCAGMA
jgi:AhpD family alkylhydroperoxidase